jgi:hypothetical protein
MSESPRWERLATFEGGTVSWLAAAPASDGAWHVFAATTVGVFRSVDRGLTWSPLGGASRVAGVEVVAPSPRYAEDGIVFAGAFDGLFRWREGGTAWEHLLTGTRVLALAVTPGAPLAPANGSDLTVLAGTETDGILVSRDGGRTWAGANAGLLDLEILAMAASPTFGEDGLAYAATATAVYRTRNGAESWRELDLSSMLEDVGAQCLALSADFAQDGVVLMGGLDRCLRRSEDRGRSWEEVPDLADCDVFGIASQEDGRFVAATDQGVALSEDGGVTWRLVGVELDGVLGAAAIVDGSRTVLLAGLADRGVVRSEDGGETWTASNGGLAGAPFVGLLLSSDFERDQTIYAYGLQTYTGVSRDGGQTWTMHDDDLESLVQIVALPDGRPVDAAAPEAMWRKLTPPSGGGQIVAVGVPPGAEHQPEAPIYLATGGQEHGADQSLTLWRTSNCGQRWDRWLEIPDIAGGTAVQVVALPEYHWGDTVLLGLGGRVYRPRPGSWQVAGGSRRPVWDTADLPGESAPGRAVAITGLVASPAYAADRTLFVATSAGVYLSRDGGASFLSWSAGLEPASTVAVAPSPAYARDRLVYALGLGGTVWRRWDQ